MNFIRKYSLYIVLAVGAAGVLASAYYEGRSTMRWGAKNDEHLQSFKDAVENAVPTHVGVWEAQSSDDQIGIENELIRRVAGAEGALARHYRSNYNRPEVHVNITCGFSRSVAAHTPDVCFTGSGSNQLTDVELFDVTYEVPVSDPENPNNFLKEERNATFKTAIFSDSGNHYQQRVFWGWKGVDTGWVAPRFPRLKWNSSEPICKMYISIMEDSGVTDQSTDTLKVAEEFFQAFLPELDAILTGKYVLPENMVIPDRPKDAAAETQTAPAASAPSDPFDLSIPGEKPKAPKAEKKDAASDSSAPTLEDAPRLPNMQNGKKDLDDEFTL